MKKIIALMVVMASGIALATTNCYTWPGGCPGICPYGPWSNIGECTTYWCDSDDACGEEGESLPYTAHKRTRELLILEYNHYCVDGPYLDDVVIGCCDCSGNKNFPIPPN